MVGPASAGPALIKDKDMNYLLVHGTGQCRIEQRADKVIQLLCVPADGEGNRWMAWELLLDGLSQVPNIGQCLKLGPGKSVAEIQEYGLMRVADDGNDTVLGTGRVQVDTGQG